MTTAVYGTSTVKRRRRTNAELDDVNDAIIDAVFDDYPVSLRGVYYRVVSAGAVDKTERGYKLVGRQLLKLRRDGTIPYGCITDGTRLIRKPRSWTGLDKCLADVAESYKRDLWQRQSVEVMVFTEKDAISGILYPVTSEWDVPLGVLRGYASETFCHTVAEEIVDANKRDKWVDVYQFGDHDPSGVNAWESFQERISMFTEEMFGIVGAKFERVAVTAHQVVEYDLPTRPTKRSDTRARDFVGESVEVDAIPAKKLRELVEISITQHVDENVLRIDQLAEESEREILTRMSGSVKQ